MPSLYWSWAISPLGSLRLLATELGLCRILLPGESGLERWVERRQADYVLVEGAPVLQQAKRQLGEYFARQRQRFDLRLDLQATPFQLAVWHAVEAIPYGSVTTYAQIAQTLGRPGAARAVGAANGANPLPIVIPCHRVVRADGSLGGYGGGLAAKAALLNLEGCVDHFFVLE